MSLQLVHCSKRKAEVLYFLMTFYLSPLNSVILGENVALVRILLKGRTWARSSMCSRIHFLCVCHVLLLIQICSVLCFVQSKCRNLCCHAILAVFVCGSMICWPRQLHPLAKPVLGQMGHYITDGAGRSSASAQSLGAWLPCLILTTSHL